MQLSPTEFDTVLDEFLLAWPRERVESMTIEQYANLADHNSYCYWLEYRSEKIGAIGGISLHKFELWKPKDDKETKDNRYTSDGRYIWSTKNGKTVNEAFFRIRQLILNIIDNSKDQNWTAIDSIPFHLIAKWKIAFIYSDRKLLPIYTKRALLEITEGLGMTFPYKTKVSILQEFILSRKKPEESIKDFAWNLYGKYASKNKKRNYYIIGSKYGDDDGKDVVPKIDEFIENQCVAIGFLGDMDFSNLMGNTPEKIQEFVYQNWNEDKPAAYKIKRYFQLLSQIKEGDIIAIKSHGAHNQLTIIAYAEVVERKGSIYEHHQHILGHHINVEFLNARFYKPLGLTYAETIHQLTPKKDGDKFYKVFGWYAEVGRNEETPNPSLIDIEEEILDQDDEGGERNEEGYNEKTEISFQRSPMLSVRVNRIHNRIQNRFIEYLNQEYTNDQISGEKNRIDAKRVTTNEIFIYEIKPFESVYSCIREGIGQLLDYSHRESTKRKINLFIVGPNKPSPNDIDFLEVIKSLLKLPFGYIAFDEANLDAIEY
ncbi:MAG: hypothetical protein HOP30_00090 [Cyclobacteriaceae bacterium]|nr:hypothetical protein [Cyclobacteriaceae bacterium]